jgi:hypothetical protein
MAARGYGSHHAREARAKALCCDRMQRDAEGEAEAASRQLPQVDTHMVRVMDFGCGRCAFDMETAMGLGRTRGIETMERARLLANVVGRTAQEKLLVSDLDAETTGQETRLEHTAGSLWVAQETLLVNIGRSLSAVQEMLLVHTGCNLLVVQEMLPESTADSLLEAQAMRLVSTGRNWSVVLVTLPDTDRGIVQAVLARALCRARIAVVGLETLLCGNYSVVLEALEKQLEGAAGAAV